MVCLDIGSGSALPSNIATTGYPNGAWVTVDLYVDDADIQAPMDNLPFRDNTVSVVYSSHALEHIAKEAVLPTLREWYRVLAPGGMLDVTVPDLEWCVRHWLEHKESRGWELDIIFGNQNHDGEFHKTGFTQDTLRALAVQAGFHVIRIGTLESHGQQSIFLLARKQES